MTLEELYDRNADQLAAATDAECIAIFAPFFNVTRPELVERARAATRVMEPPKYVSPAKQNALNMLKESGIDLSELGLRKRKK
jgi:hypothetical protein